MAGVRLGPADPAPAVPSAELLLPERSWRHHPASEHEREQAQVRGAVRQFLVAGLVTLAVVAAPSALIMRQLALDYTLEDLERSTALIARGIVAHGVDDGLLAGEPEAVAAMEARVGDRLAPERIDRLNIWSPDGVVVWSTEPFLIGGEYPEHDWNTDVRERGLPMATFEDHGAPRFGYEPRHGRFVEIDVPFVSPAGDELILEVFYPSSVVHDRQTHMLLSLLPVGLVTLLVLQLAQLPPAVRLARRIQSLQSGRRRLLRQAAAASDLERRRIARDLHDDVVQELAGTSYVLESVTRRADDDTRPSLERAGGSVRRSVVRLRGLMAEVYPADLDSVGLLAALEGLAERLRASDVVARVTVPDEPDLDPTTATLLYRVAREAVTNVLKHAEAGSVEISLEQTADGVAVTVVDDGAGFDLSGPAADGHLGLTLVRDVIAEVGGVVEVVSARGAGTRVRATIPQH
nr:ATP-binding protein [uncultured Actinotalea sp.]